ncbi:PAS domain S-box protein [Stutzerimonas urumqiensis]|uniref:PAS domain S-box protein n=1 Tax=Stutzerimonas urumqiensis TaxID=638269 RepID=UPI003DA404DB
MDESTDSRLPPSPLPALDGMPCAILESITDYAIIATDLAGRITFWNAGATRVFGWSGEAILGQPIDRIFTPQDRSSGRPQEERHLALISGRALDERWHLRGDGSEFWSAGETMPLRQPDGTLIGYVKVARDHTERRLALEVAREQGRAAHLPDQAAQGASLLLDLEGRIRHLSEGARRLLGIDEGAPIADLDWLEFWCPEDRLEARNAVAAARHGASTRFQGQVELAPLGKRWWDVRIGPCLDDSGNPERLHVRMRDITYGHQDAAPAPAHQAHIELPTESVKSIVWVTDANGEVDTPQPGWEALTGQTFEQYRGLGWTQAVHPGDIRSAMADWQAAIAERRAYRVECRVRRRDGSWGLFSISSTPQFDEDGRITGWIGAHIDISSHRAAQEALHLETNRLRILNRVGARLAAELDLDKLVQEATDAGVALSGAQFGAFFYNVVDPQGERYTLYALSGAPREAFSRFPMPRNTAVFGQTFTGQGVVRSDDITQDPRYGKSAPHHGMPRGHLPVRSYLAVPVISRSGEVLGGLLFGHEAPAMFSEEHEHLLTGIAGQAAIAIDNARLFRDLQREVDQRRQAEALAQARNERLSILSEAIEKAPAAHHLEDLMSSVSHAARRLCGADGVAVVLREGDQCFYASEVTPVPLWKGRRFPLMSCISGWSMVHRQTAVVVDVARDERLLPELYEPTFVRSLVMVPIVIDGEALAAIGAYWRERHESGAEEVATLEALARSAGAVLKRLEAEQALRTLNETLETQVAERTADRDRMWRLSTDMMLVARFDGTITAVNPAWQVHLGWREDELVGHSFLELVHPDDLEVTRLEAARLASGAITPRFENRYRHRDGSYRWLSWIAVPDEGLIHAVGRDVSAEKEQAQALLQAEEALRQAQKMDAIGQLTGGIAHDFNNLLTGIVGSLDMMQVRIAQGRLDAIERYHNAAMTSANRAAALTHRLLAFARRQPLDPKTVDANRLVQAMEELLRRTLGETIEMELVLAGGLWPTRCDPNQLESAILNLAINARDAMPDGGRLVIETCNTHLDRTYTARFRTLKPGQYVCVSVTDTGTGMTPQTVERAFDPFFTTKPVGQGTGLGLSMIYGFAQQSEGHARIYSEVGQGTTVKLYLPRAHAEVEPDAPSEASQSDNRSLQGESVLVVEDEPVVRALIVEVLHDLGYRPLEAGDGLVGLSMVEEHPNLDLLITDMGLPGLNGRQLADQARADRPDLKVLFITGYAENATLASGFLEPGMEMITKPFSVDTLAERVREMIER